MEAAAAYRHRRLRIGALLLRNGLLSADKLAEALEEKEKTGERLGEIVVRRGWVTEAQVAELLADQSDLPFVSLSSTPPETRVESLLSSRVGAYFRAVPVRFLDEHTVLVAVSDPTSVTVEDLRSAIGLDVRFAVATDSDIKAALAKLDPSLPAEPLLGEVTNADTPAGGGLPGGADEPEAAPDAPAAPVDGVPEPVAEGTSDTPDGQAAGDALDLVSGPVDLQPVDDDLPGPPGAEPELAAAPEPAPEDRLATGDAESPEELVAIVEIPEALRADLEPPVEIPAVELFPPAGGPVPTEPSPADELPADPAPGLIDLSMVEPVAGVPLLRVVGPPSGDTPVPAGEGDPDADLHDEHDAPATPAAGAGPIEPSAPSLWLPASATEGAVPTGRPDTDDPPGASPVDALRWAPAGPWWPGPAGTDATEGLDDEAGGELPRSDATAEPDPDATAAAGDGPEAAARYEDEAAVPGHDEDPEQARTTEDAVEPAPVEAVEVTESFEPSDAEPTGSVERVEDVQTEVLADDPHADLPWATPSLDEAPEHEAEAPEPAIEPEAVLEPETVLEPEAAIEPEPEAVSPEPVTNAVTEDETGAGGETADGGSSPQALQTIESSLFPVADAAEGAAIVPLFEHRRPQLGTILLRQGLVTPEQLAVALEEKEESGDRLGRILVDTGALSELGLASALAEQHDIDYVDIASAPPNVAVASLLPAKYARRYRALPVRYLDGGTLLVAVADPTDVLASDDLRLVLGVPIQLAVALGSEIDAAIDRVHPEGTAASPEPSPGSEHEEGSGEGDALLSGFRRQGHIEVLEATTNAPAIELVNEVIKHAIQDGASDVHFEPQSERMLVRARIDGVMRELRVIPARLQQAVSARLKIMGELDIAERRAPQDGRVTITFGGRPVDLRIAVLPTLHGEQIVIRILYRSSNAVDLADLGLATDTETAIRHAIAQPYGALLSVGPTGSGKTTTLYSALRLLNTEDRCVMTIEDPVEYQLEGLNQVQVNVKAGLTFAHGLRTILRSDPDVLLVGEIRDSETAKIAVQAAMTGHLVLSTLHADNVGSAVSRMTDMGVERQLLASTVNVILAQRLARKLCTNCREAFQLDPGLLVKAGVDERVLPGDGPVRLFKPRGCGQCAGGYKGRIGLFETMLVTPKMRRLMETATAEEIYEVAVADGMRTLQDDGLRLCVEGLTSLDEVKRVAGERRI